MVILILASSNILMDQRVTGDRNAETRSSLQVVLSEVAPYGTDASGEDWIELLVVNGSGDISGFVITTFDSQDNDEELADSTVTVAKGDRIVVHYNETAPDETDATMDTNSNGFVDLYIASSDLSGTNEQAAIYSSADHSEPLDAVCWSNGDISENEAKDAKELADAGMWPSNSAGAMVDSSNLEKGISIARIEGISDSNTKNDWYGEPHPSAGSANRFFNFSGDVLITGAYLSKAPRYFTMEVISGGGDVSCLVLTDLDGQRDFLSESPLTLSQGDVFRVYYGEGTNETDAMGDADADGIRELYSADMAPASTTDSAVLMRGVEVLDVLAWCDKGPLASGEVSDLNYLVAEGEWVGNTSGDCVNISLMGTGNELLRKIPLTDTDSKDDWEISGEIKKDIKLKEFNLTTFSSVDSVTCGVSPDSSFGMVAGLIDNAEESIHIEVYILDNYKIAEKLLAALERGVSVKIFLEGAPIGIPDMEKYIMELITDNGGEVRYMISDAGAGAGERFTNIHSKFMVVDGTKTFITSENFRLDGISYYGTSGNRGWSVIVESHEVGEYFNDVFYYDFSPSSPDSFSFTVDHETYGGPSSDFDPSSRDYKPSNGNHEITFQARKFTEDITVTPVLCPDHTSDREAILPLIESAQEYVYVQQHSVNDAWKKGSNYVENEYLEALYDAARKGVEVRIQFDETFKFSNNHWEIINDTNDLAAEEGLNMMAKFTYNKEIDVAKVHNKGIIVDGDKVLISSINWATNSIYNNRETGVIIESAEVAGYYREIFVFDWGGEEIVAMGSIGGVVKDETGKPLKGAEVTIDSLGISATTDEDGEFVFENTPVGSYVLNISLKGHDDVHIYVKAKIGETTTESFTMEKKGSAGEDENGLSITLLIILAVILILVVIILVAVILNAKKVRVKEKGKTVTRLSGDQHPFDDRVEKE